MFHIVLFTCCSMHGYRDKSFKSVIGTCYTYLHSFFSSILMIRFLLIVVLLLLLSYFHHYVVVFVSYSIVFNSLVRCYYYCYSIGLIGMRCWNVWKKVNNNKVQSQSSESWTVSKNYEQKIKNLKIFHICFVTFLSPLIFFFLVVWWVVVSVFILSNKWKLKLLYDQLVVVSIDSLEAIHQDRNEQQWVHNHWNWHYWLSYLLFTLQYSIVETRWRWPPNKIPVPWWF